MSRNHILIKNSTSANSPRKTVRILGSELGDPRLEKTDQVASPHNITSCIIKKDNVRYFTTQNSENDQNEQLTL